MTGDTTPGQADGIPDAYARYIRAVFPPEVLASTPNEITGRWRHMTGPAEREFWRSLDVPPELAVAIGDRNAFRDAADYERNRVINLTALVRDMLQAFPDTADEQEWRDRAGGLGVQDPDGNPYRAYTEEDL